MEFILDSIEGLIYIYEEIFWLKECLTVFKSIIVFALVKWMHKFSYGAEFFLYLGTLIGVTCIFFGDIGYLSDNDVLKLIAPTCLYLLIYNKNENIDTILFAFLIPYSITSFEFYRSFYIAIESIGSHLLIIFCIMIVKENIYLSLFISIVIGLLINLIGYNSPPGTNDLLLNPALITLSVKGLEFYTKNTRYTEFLKSFWATLLCFAYFGSWIFHCIKPICPLEYNLK
ncbi:MAG: hypothetical protein QY310_00805 [Candidatus Jettenia sp. CY-1]|nr:MAG: hypothetical protein QY310_00805 [Candidatus Jettenia sp. CY-1]